MMSETVAPAQCPACRDERIGLSSTVRPQHIYTFDCAKRARNPRVIPPHTTGDKVNDQAAENAAELDLGPIESRLEGLSEGVALDRRALLTEVKRLRAEVERLQAQLREAREPCSICRTTDARRHDRSAHDRASGFDV